MKHYNIQNYIRYKKDLEESIKRIPHKEFSEYTRDELIITFLPLVENLASLRRYGYNRFNTRR